MMMLREAFGIERLKVFVLKNGRTFDARPARKSWRLELSRHAIWNLYALYVPCLVSPDLISRLSLYVTTIQIDKLFFSFCFSLSSRNSDETVKEIKL